MKGYKMLLLAVLLLSGQFALAVEYNKIAISGTVENPSAREIRVVFYNYVPGEDSIASSATLDASNSFYFISQIREPVFARIFYGKDSFPLYLEPGYDLRINFDATKIPQTLQFIGAGAENNAFLASRSFRYEMDQAVLNEKIKKSDAAKFKEWAAKRRQSQQTFLNECKNELTTSFVELQLADIDYGWANELSTFFRFQEGKKKGKALAGTQMKFFDEVKLHNYDVILLQSYRNFLENYIQYNYALMKEALPKGNSQYYNNMYKVTKNSLRSLPMYHMQAVYLVEALEHLGVDYVKDEYIEFANECPVQAYKNTLHQMVKAQTVAPKKAEIILTNKRGKTVALKELKGNIVLVRFTNFMDDSASQLVRKHDEALKDRLAAYEEVKFLELPMEYNQEAYAKMVYADATEYLKSIMNRPKPGQEKPKTPPFSYILLNREGLVVSNSLDDPHNELAMEKIDALLRQEKRNAIVE